MMVLTFVWYRASVLCELMLHNFKRTIKKPYLLDQLKKVFKRYKRVVYNMHIISKSAYLVQTPITVYSYGFYFNCKAVGRA